MGWVQRRESPRDMRMPNNRRRYSRRAQPRTTRVHDPYAQRSTWAHQGTLALSPSHYILLVRHEDASGCLRCPLRARYSTEPASASCCHFFVAAADLGPGTPWQARQRATKRSVACSSADDGRMHDVASVGGAHHLRRAALLSTLSFDGAVARSVRCDTAARSRTSCSHKCGYVCVRRGDVRLREASILAAIVPTKAALSEGCKKKWTRRAHCGHGTAYFFRQPKKSRRTRMIKRGLVRRIVEAPAHREDEQLNPPRKELRMASSSVGPAAGGVGSRVKWV